MPRWVFICAKGAMLDGPSVRHAARSGGNEATRNLVERGDVKRGIPACVSCHSISAGGPIETPTLAGQRAEYISAQLSNYKSGDRQNDIYHRMRSIAGKLRDEEIANLAQYYSRTR